ncbi:regulatory protein, luxR family [Palleronia salina]|uniref:Regulatory protein, luxR family n=1 Tax=Palleronia salina TaxID=313368 RepID=A0A1M6HR96_9RHOB|nr:helix-turn-helix transcriptional regulator [Palleronia salina]SHJ24687.1 regulatory protein, luxR family [Palleronia salina]
MIRLVPDTRLPAGLTAMMAVQAGCVVFFLGDLVADARAQLGTEGASFHLSIEAVATFALLAAIGFEARYLRDLMRSKARLERNLQIASAAVHEVIEAHFTRWKLSPSETDVATFLVKGFEIAEIARIRGCAEGTVKAHLNAIYRKSGTHNRGQLLSLLIDSLMAGPTDGAPHTEGHVAAQ